MNLTNKFLDKTINSFADLSVHLNIKSNIQTIILHYIYTRNVFIFQALFINHLLFKTVIKMLF